MDSIAPKSKHFGFQYKLMGEGHDVLKVQNWCKEFGCTVSTSWNYSKELEVASLEALFVFQ